jgi:hypothetical protein
VIRSGKEDWPQINAEGRKSGQNAVLISTPISAGSAAFRVDLRPTLFPSQPVA